MQAIISLITYFLVMGRVVTLIGMEALGLWSLTMSLVAFVRMLDLGGAQILARLLATGTGQDLRQAQFVDSTALTGLTAFIIFGIAAYFGLKPVLLDLVKPDLQVAAGWLLLGLTSILPLNFLALVHLGGLDGAGRADMRAIVAICALVLYSATALLMIGPHGLMGLVYAQLAQQVFTIVVARVLLVRRIAPLGLVPYRFSRAVLRETISFGTRLQISLLPMALFDPLCRLLIGRWAGLELLGTYELASKFAASARTVVQAFANPMMPEFARLIVEDQAGAKSQFYRNQVQVAAGGMLVSTLQILALPLASYQLLGTLDPTFILVSSVLSLAWGLTCIGLAVNLYARAAGQLWQSTVGQWSLLALGALLVHLAAMLGNHHWVLIAPALAILIGHLIAFFGECRFLGLDPMARGSRTMVASFLALSLTALIVIATSIVQLEPVTISAEMHMSVKEAQ